MFNLFSMKLVDNVIRSMKVGKVFKDNQEGINHLHFSNDGSMLISSSDDDQVTVTHINKCFLTLVMHWIVNK